LTNPPQEIPDMRAEEDQAEIPDPEAEAYATVGIPLVPQSWMWFPPLMSGKH